jgi:NAD(P)-dependent dehydrogenase (short-subunit alcohol dehydrogenase family)
MNKQPIALVTGASRGIGQLTARALLARRYRVFGTARQPEGNTREGIEMLALDVRSQTSVDACVAAVITHAGRIDVLVNNAGYDLYGAFEDTSPSEFEIQIDTNFNGAVRVLRTVAPLMRAQRGGRIVNVSSLGGALALPYNGAYAASKFALEGLSESMRYEYLPHNVFISLAQPGQVRTDTLAQSIQSVAARRSVHGFDSAKLADRARKAGLVASLGMDQTARAIADIVTARRPQLRYRIGSQARGLLLMRALLPERIFERMIMKLFVENLAAPGFAKEAAHA